MNKNTIHTEETFEEAIETSLLEDGGYVKGNTEDFDRTLALDSNQRTCKCKNISIFVPIITKFDSNAV